MEDYIYEGKAKYLLEWDDDPDKIIQRFKDDATAFNGEKFAQFDGKGKLNCAISSHIFDILEKRGIPTHFDGRISDTDQLIDRVDIVPVEVVVRNVVGGSLAGRTGLEKGTPVDPPIVETFYKKDDLGDPILADAHVYMLDLCEPDELNDIKQLALRVNEVVKEVFGEADLLLADFKMEFGYNAAGKLVLADEISPDTSRIWEEQGDGSYRSLDKDVFRHDRGDLIETYEEVADRLGVDVDLVED